jgi:hypothetical protein
MVEECGEAELLSLWQPGRIYIYIFFVYIIYTYILYVERKRRMGAEPTPSKACPQQPTFPNLAPSTLIPLLPQ